MIAPENAVATGRSRVGLALLLLLLNLILCVGAAELIVRVALGDMDYAMEMWKYAHLLKRVAGDPAQVFTHVPGGEAHLMGVDVRINSLGLRNRESPHPKAPGAHRILMLGDSLTFGWGVAADDVTSVRLERLLRERDPRSNWEVINSGVGNYNTRLEVHYLENEGLSYSPDVVVLNYFINDAETDPRPSGNFINLHSAAWVFVANRLDVVSRLLHPHDAWDAYYHGLYREPAEGWRGAREALLQFGQLCRANRLRCLVVHQPELHQIDPYPFPEVQEAVARATSSAGLPLLDLLPALHGEDPRRLWVSREDTHPNARCDAVYASAIAELLLKEPLSPSPQEPVEHAH